MNAAAIALFSPRRTGGGAVAPRPAIAAARTGHFSAGRRTARQAIESPADVGSDHAEADSRGDPGAAGRCGPALVPGGSRRGRARPEWIRRSRSRVSRAGVGTTARRRGPQRRSADSCSCQGGRVSKVAGSDLWGMVENPVAACIADLRWCPSWIPSRARISLVTATPGSTAPSTRSPTEYAPSVLLCLPWARLRRSRWSGPGCPGRPHAA